VRGYAEESLEVTAMRALRSAARKFVASELLLGAADRVAVLDLADAARNYAVAVDEDAARRPSRSRRSAPA